MQKSEKGPERLDINRVYEEYVAAPSEKAMENVIRAGLPLIRHFAAIYGAGCTTEDLTQSGLLGLVEAVSRYNGRTLFSTWASWCIISEIRHYVRREQNYSRPKCIARLQKQACGLLRQARRAGAPPPETEQLAARLRIRPEGLPEVMRAGLVSFDEIDAEKIDSASYQTFRLPIEDRLALEQALQKLGELERRVIDALFYRGLTQQQTADEMGLSQRKVSRVKVAALRRLGWLLEGPNFRLVSGKHSFHLVHEDMSANIKTTG